MKRVPRSSAEVKADLDLVNELQIKLQQELRISEENEKNEAFINSEHFSYIESSEFSIGDTVYIKNEITVPSNVIANKNDRISIVRRVTEDKVFIRTVNGLKTWRYKKNLLLVVNKIENPSK